MQTHTDNTRTRSFKRADFRKCVMNATLLAATDKAVMVCNKNGADVWLPRSQITLEPAWAGKDDFVRITVPQWLKKSRSLSASVDQQHDNDTPVFDNTRSGQF